MIEVPFYELKSKQFTSVCQRQMHRIGLPGTQRMNRESGGKGWLMRRELIQTELKRLRAVYTLPERWSPDSFRGRRKSSISPKNIQFMKGLHDGEGLFPLAYPLQNSVNREQAVSA
jgi:hypothetical protein